MACETMRKPKQTLAERIAEITKAVGLLQARLLDGRVKAKVGPQGAIAFVGWTAADRDGVTDACAYRRIMSTGSALARVEIAKAEQLAGRSVNRQIVGQGVHSHDGGKSWHDGH